MVFKIGVLEFTEMQWQKLLRKLIAEQRVPFYRLSMSSEQRGSGEKPGALTGKHLLQRHLPLTYLLRIRRRGSQLRAACPALL